MDRMYFYSVGKGESIRASPVTFYTAAILEKERVQPNTQGKLKYSTSIFASGTSCRIQLHFFGATRRINLFRYKKEHALIASTTLSRCWIMGYISFHRYSCTTCTFFDRHHRHYSYQYISPELSASSCRYSCGGFQI